MFLNLALVLYALVLQKLPLRMWVCASLTHAPSISSKEVHLYFRLTDKQQSLQRTVTAKNNDCKELSLQRIRMNKNRHRKERLLQRTVTAKNTHCKELQLAVFQGRLARKLRFHIVNLLLFQEVSCEKTCFHIVKLQFLRGVTHESFVFTTALCSFLTETSHQSFVCTTLQFFKCRMPPSLHLRPILGVSCRPLHQRTWFWLRCHESFRLFATAMLIALNDF